ncbi:MAG: DMT family transporter [Deltaproteobacteria bacterium]|nr:DMT family transporter [Deltaproteobacteria bacterium]
MTLASFFFAVMTVSARLGSSEVPWTEVALARSFFGLAVAIGVARARRVSLRIENARVAWGRSICGTIAMFTTFYTIGAPEIALGDAASLRSTSPVFIALLAPRFLGESSGWRVWVATPISFAGVVLLAKPSFQLASHLAMLCLVAAFFSAIAMMFLRRLGASEAPEAVAAHFSFVATAVMLVAALPGFAAPDGRAWFLLIGTGVSAGLGQLAMTRAYALDHAARVGTIGYLGVVMTQILAAWWLGEIPDALQLAGSALVVGAGVLLAAAALRPARRRPPPLTPPSTR